MVSLTIDVVIRVIFDRLLSRLQSYQYDDLLTERLAMKSSAYNHPNEYDCLHVDWVQNVRPSQPPMIKLWIYWKNNIHFLYVEQSSESICILKKIKSDVVFCCARPFQFVAQARR